MYLIINLGEFMEYFTCWVIFCKFVWICAELLIYMQHMVPFQPIHLLPSLISNLELNGYPKPSVLKNHFVVSLRFGSDVTAQWQSCSVIYKGSPWKTEIHWYEWTALPRDQQGGKCIGGRGGRSAHMEKHVHVMPLGTGPTVDTSYVIRETEISRSSL